MAKERKTKQQIPIYKKPDFWVITVGVIMVTAMIVIATIISTSPKDNSSTKISDGYELDSPSGETMTVIRVRMVISQNALDGRGKMYKKECTTLGKIAKKLDPSAEYFDRCTGVLYANTADTSKSNVITLSDGTYCATFTFDKELDFLKDYSFDQKTCKGYSTPLYDSD